MNTAFNNVEQTAIMPTTKASDKSISGLGDSLNSPSLNGEKIFMLSVEEAATATYGFMDVNSLYKNNRSLALKPTAYALRVGNLLINSNGNTRFERVGSVDENGWLSYYFVDDSYIGVNPALNLNTSSLFLQEQQMLV